MQRPRGSPTENLFSQMNTLIPALTICLVGSYSLGLFINKYPFHSQKHPSFKSKVSQRITLHIAHTTHIVA